jgi:predicted O-methyltransferase YrrM
MFTKEDYLNYFDELLDLLQQTLVIYTDVLNDIKDEAIRSKLSAVTSETMEAFRFIKEQKSIFI